MYGGSDRNIGVPSFCRRLTNIDYLLHASVWKMAPFIDRFEFCFLRMLSLQFATFHLFHFCCWSCCYFRFHQHLNTSGKAKFSSNQNILLHTLFAEKKVITTIILHYHIIVFIQRQVSIVKSYYHVDCYSIEKYWVVVDQATKKTLIPEKICQVVRSSWRPGWLIFYMMNLLIPSLLE